MGTHFSQAVDGLRVIRSVGWGGKMYLTIINVR